MFETGSTFSTGSVVMAASDARPLSQTSPAYPVIFKNGKVTSDCPKTAGIYYWKNNVNGKGYVGQSLKLRSRTGSYVRGDFSDQRAFYAAVQKYGIANFTCYKVMDCCPSKVALNYWETYWIKKLDVFDSNGYNLTSGGDSYNLSKSSRDKIGNASRSRSKDTLEKMSRSHIGKKWSKEQREKQMVSRRNVSPETRRKLSIAASNISLETRRKRSIAARNMSTEARRKIGDASRGRVVSTETRAKIGKIHKGMKVSEQTKLILSHKAKLQHNTLWKDFFIYDAA